MNEETKEAKGIDELIAQYEKELAMATPGSEEAESISKVLCDLYDRKKNFDENEIRKDSDEKNLKESKKNRIWSVVTKIGLAVGSAALMVWSTNREYDFELGNRTKVFNASKRIDRNNDDLIKKNIM